MGRRGPKPKAPPPPTLKPQGKGPTKRTPTSQFDSAAGNDIYEPERIVAQRMAKGVTQFCVKWAGYETKDNTWEPIENLAGCEDMIVEFKEREKTRIAQVEATAQAKRREAQEAAAKDAAEKAAAAAAERLRAREEGDGDESSTPTRSSPRLAEATAKISKEPQYRRRSNPFWECFDATAAGQGRMCCKLMKADGGLCGEVISVKNGPTGLQNHGMYKHPDEFIKLRPIKEGDAEPVDYSKLRERQTTVNALPAKHRDKIHKAHARWIVKKKRPFSICEDSEYQDVRRVAMNGAYLPPNHHLVNSNILLLSSEGQERLQNVNKTLLANGIKPSIAGDIWSDREAALLGLCEYYIDDNWEMQELVLAASPFTERHTGVAIDEQTKEACVKAGLTHDVFSSVFYAVSDNASNMKSGWASFNRGPCCVHTAQLSVKVYLDHEDIKQTRVKEHGIVAHFSYATGVDGLGALKRCQQESNLPTHHPVKDVETRWSSGHDQMEWFRVQQRALQLYDINHARKAGDAD